MLNLSTKNASYGLFILILLGMCAFPLSLPSSFRIDETRDPLFEKIPMTIGRWSGKDSELDERTYEILETRNVLSRLYETAEGKKVHLLLVGSHRDRRVAHPPEVCYVSSNYSILDTREEVLNIKGESIAVKEFLAKHERQNALSEHVLYVYKVGDRFTTNYYAQQFLFAWDRLTRKKSQVLLIRLSGPDKSLFQDFLSEILLLVV